jgi:hypothetical protein
LNTANRSAICRCILEKVRDRGLDKTICPSEVARELGGEEWRSLMPEIRAVGADLVESDMIQATQRGQIVNPLQVKGPIRFKVTEKGLKDSPNQKGDR